MFAVSGWDLPAGPIVQECNDTKKEKKKKNKKKKDHGTGANVVELTPEVKERIKAREKKLRDAARKDVVVAKAKGGEKKMVVTKENVGELWEKVIEGKERKKDGKKRKRGEGGSGRDRKGDGEKMVEKGVDGNEDMPVKKKRKGKASLQGVAPEDLLLQNTIASAGLVADSSASTLTPLQLKMRQKLTSARFRHINETLYTTPSQNSLSLFRSQPSMYADYHAGFRQQVSVWPSNPVDTFIALLKSRSATPFSKGHSRKLNASSPQPLPRCQDSGICTVADLGCGDAKIAATFNHHKDVKKLKIKVLSYDLQASTTDVEVADIAHLPLSPESVDVVIFCLALMGTNFLDFVDEAFRVLKWRGEMWVAEIKSRFVRKNSSLGGICRGKGKGKAATENQHEDEDEGEGILAEGETKRDDAAYKLFVDALSKRGFVLRGNVDDGNKMFVRMEFVKQRVAEIAEAGDRFGKKKRSRFIDDGEELKEGGILKPCVYKLR